jgi:hypothetical protein
MMSSSAVCAPMGEAVRHVPVLLEVRDVEEDLVAHRMPSMLSGAKWLRMEVM